MSTSRSEAGVRTAAWTAVVATLLGAVAFYVAQNRLALTGGSVALSKSVWLGLALLFWLILPAIIVCDARVASDLKRPFMLLMLLMAARGIAELWMLYVLRNWSPRYGIVHDLVCLTVLWVCGARLLRTFHARGTAARSLLVHCFVTGALFIPEIYYAWYMQAHFTTDGDHPIYFVPDDGSHRFVLGVTGTVDLLCLAYLVLFLRSWLHGKTQRPHP